MRHNATTLIVGLGSSHGDDQAGWLVADLLAINYDRAERIVVRRGLIPLDVIDWLDNIDTLHICDACETSRSRRRLHRFQWAAGRLVSSDKASAAETIKSPASFRSRGSHDFGVLELLSLAEVTHQLPKQVTIWAIEGSDFQPGGAMSETTRQVALSAVNKIAEESGLIRARATPFGSELVGQRHFQNKN